jgi:hypothetical protein
MVEKKDEEIPPSEDHFDEPVDVNETEADFDAEETNAKEEK